MISALQIQEILSLYKKHGWTLRRVLLTEKLKNHLGNLTETMFGGAEVEVVSAEIDAAWFARQSGAEREAWEIRHLSETPFALLEIFEAEDDEEIREEARKEVEAQMQERFSR